jgi:hypothetical protein
MERSSFTWREYWVTEKCKLAARLNAGEAGGTYAEAVLVVCAAMSALSAELWSGPRIDRVRFIEMLARDGPNPDNNTIVSVPLLIQHLERSSRNSAALQLRNVFGVPDTALVVTGPNVDTSEDHILALLPRLDLKEVRQFSYASLLYREVRSSYVHDYRPGKQADSWPMTMLADQRISYINRIADDMKMQRLVHFHFEGLAQLAIQMASSADKTAAMSPRPRPQVWWADGG